MDYRFVQVDVFTGQMFGGNQLAVFTDAQGLFDRQMQSIANEMNLSETTFIFPPENPKDLIRLRIFTPGKELPFAGHPTVGTTYVLATTGLATTNSFSLRLNVGSIPVTVQGDLGAPEAIWMTQPLPTLGEPMTHRADIAKRLGVETENLLDSPIRVASAGTPFIFVGLKSLEAVDRVELGDRDLSTIVGATGANGVFVFAPEAGGVYSRMLGSHGLGIVEDPATGGASGPLGAVLVNVLSRQGVRMGRPSDVFIRLAYNGDELGTVEVGGSVVPVLEGVLRLAGA